jgi:hypothetical protein
MLKKIYRATIWVVLLTFGFQALGGNVWAQIVHSQHSQGIRQKKTTGEEWVEAINEIANCGFRIADLKTKANKLEGIDKKLRKEFKETEEFLKEKNLPGNILKRHYDFVKKYNENYAKLQEKLKEAITTKKTKDLKDL